MEHCSNRNNLSVSLQDEGVFARWRARVTTGVCAWCRTQDATCTCALRCECACARRWPDWLPSNGTIRLNTARLLRSSVRDQRSHEGAAVHTRHHARFCGLGGPHQVPGSRPAEGQQAVVLWGNQVAGGQRRSPGVYGRDTRAGRLAGQGEERDAADGGRDESVPGRVGKGQRETGRMPEREGAKVIFDTK